MKGGVKRTTTFVLPIDKMSYLNQTNMLEYASQRPVVP